MLRLFGTPHYQSAAGALAGLPEKAYVLIAMLVMERGRPLAREKIRAILWEDAPASRAADSLRWLLSRIRKWQVEHAVQLVTITRDAVELDAGARIDVAMLLDFPPPQTSQDLLDLAGLYRGELLEGPDADAGPLLAEQLRNCRVQLRQHFLAMVRAAATRISGETSARVLSDLFAEDASDEELARALLVRVAADKGPDAVRATYAMIVSRLRDEFDSAPSLETRSLFAQLVPSPGTVSEHPATTPGTEESGGIPRIVLTPPEVPLPVDPRISLLADAMIEDVCLQLCRMRTFAMFAPHTARQVAGLEPAIAVAPFGVRYHARTMLMPRSDGGLRLALSLIQTGSGAIIFGDQFDFDETTVGMRFAEITETIAMHVASAVERVEIGAYRRTGAASAYVQYLLGSQVLDSNDLKRLRRARHHFVRALDLEPAYVPALTGIARTLTKEALALRRTDVELTQRAKGLAEEAVRIDPLDPNAWREKAAASLYLHDIDASLEFLDAALSRAPHHADIIAEKAEVLVHASRPKEAKQLVTQAMELNPLPPDDYHWILGMSEFFLGRYEATLTALMKMKNTDSVSRLIAAAAAMKGDMPLAASYRERWLQIYPDSRLENFTQFMPHANKADVEHYVDALRRAGFP